MATDQIQSLCELGQDRLERMEYLAAETVLAQAEEIAWGRQDWDAISRLYMPLQETRRQRRQRCGEGIVQLDLIAKGPGDAVSVEYQQGQFLIAGWNSLEPGIQLRKRATNNNLYVETFLAKVLPKGLSPSSDTPGEGRGEGLPQSPTVNPHPNPLPEYRERGQEQIVAVYPLEDSIESGFILQPDEIPKGPRKGNAETYAIVMSWWERLHAPFLAAADAQINPIEKMAAYRKTIEVDYACELAHQRLSDVARSLCIHKRGL
jgi:hypothetical protein